MGNCISSHAIDLADKQSPAVDKTQEESDEIPPASVVTSLRDEQGYEQLGAEYDRHTMKETDCGYPTSLQEELNEMLEAIYSMISEEDMKAYQKYLREVEKQKVAEKAIKAVSPAPGFRWIDQDNEWVSLEEVCQKGLVVLQFYRGKWCPHCNAGLMAYNNYLQKIQERGATLLAISPMLPDGSQFLATKRNLRYAVLSDVGNTVAREYRITFVVPENVRPTFEAWGHDLPTENGDDLWELPLAAT
jgi:peroxiredoxin